MIVCPDCHDEGWLKNVCTRCKGVGVLATAPIDPVTESAIENAARLADAIFGWSPVMPSEGGKS